MWHVGRTECGSTHRSPCAILPVPGKVSSTMPEETNSVRPDLPIEILDRIDRVCDRFEAAWDRGEHPRIEDELGAVEPRYRGALLRDLLAAELSARRRRGERPAPRDYHDRLRGRPRDGGCGLRRDHSPGATPAPPAASRPGRTAGVPDRADRPVRDGGGPPRLGGDGPGRCPRFWRTGGSSTTRGGPCWKRWPASACGSTAATSRGAWRRCRRATAPASGSQSLADTDLDATMGLVGVAPTEPGAAGFHLADGYSVGSAAAGDAAVPRPAAPRPGRAGRRLRGDGHGELHREVALEQILEGHADDPVSRSRFLSEAEITGGLEHPGIVPVYGLGTYADGRPYYAMRFIQGDSLKEAIGRFHRTKRHSKDEPRPARRWSCASCCDGSSTSAMRSTTRTAAGCCTATSSRATSWSAGTARRSSSTGAWRRSSGRVTATPAAGERPLPPSSAERFGARRCRAGALGTPALHEPRAGRGRAGATRPASDVYSLGATLYCLLTGEAAIRRTTTSVSCSGRCRMGDFPRRGASTRRSTGRWRRSA